MAVALIHHVAISNNVPLVDVADYFPDLGNQIVIVFVPKSDSQVKRLLASRVNIFPDYNEGAFQSHYKIIEKISVAGSERSMDLIKRQ